MSKAWVCKVFSYRRNGWELRRWRSLRNNNSHHITSSKVTNRNSHCLLFMPLTWLRRSRAPGGDSRLLPRFSGSAWGCCGRVEDAVTVLWPCRDGNYLGDPLMLRRPCGDTYLRVGKMQDMSLSPSILSQVSSPDWGGVCQISPL